MMDSHALRLYLVADPDHVRGDIREPVVAAIAGGVTMVQLRAKSLTDREHTMLAVALAAICHEQRIPFIVNDRLDIALAARADGVHLGVDDLPIADARRLAPDGFIIGYSPETDAQAMAADDAGMSYLGVGPVFGTRTKVDAGDALGLEHFGHRCTISPVPVVGIGGIDASNAASVMQAGAAGVAVVSAVLSAPDPAEASRRLRTAIGEHQSGIMQR